jgi:hypothetical protein
MAKGLIIMQNGRETVVPNTPSIRKFWEDYNTQIGRSRIANKKFVTIIEADDATVARCLTPAQVKKSVPVTAVNDENAELKKELAELKNMVIRMYAGQPAPGPTPQIPPVEALNEEFQAFD